MLILWQFEECEHSQPVRRKLTELALDFIAINAPPGHPEKDAVMEKLFGNNRTPSLWDTRNGTLLQGEAAICDYLEGRARPGT
ncbi:MAG: glutathione S-transferase N-terminal domain-containing protein [Armatimonadota bacterium]